MRVIMIWFTAFEHTEEISTILPKYKKTILNFKKILNAILSENDA